MNIPEGVLYLYGLIGSGALEREVAVLRRVEA